MPKNTLNIPIKGNTKLMEKDVSLLSHGALGGALLLFGAVGVVGVAVYLGMLSPSVLTTLTLSVIIGVSVVCLVTVLMMPYAALQRQPVGMNQPLGIAVGVLLVLGFMFIPNAFPAKYLHSAAGDSWAHRRVVDVLRVRGGG